MTTNADIIKCYLTIDSSGPGCSERGSQVQSTMGKGALYSRHSILDTKKS